MTEAEELKHGIKNKISNIIRESNTIPCRCSKYELWMDYEKNKFSSRKLNVSCHVAIYHQIKLKQNFLKQN